MLISKLMIGQRSIVILLGLLICLCAKAQMSHPVTVIGPQNRTQPLNAIIPQLAQHRVVFIGETHDRYHHHLNQLEVIRQLHEHQHRWAIGLEQFQQPFQAHLDAYIAGDMSENELLRNTKYFQRWSYDYRLYRPILRYAKAQGIPLIALNIDRDLHRKAARGDELSDTERNQLPTQIDRSDSAYRDRLETIFAQHPEGVDVDFERFWEAQLLWDESMAERAVQYLNEHPENHLVILAGSGHIEYGSGIPQRIQRRSALPSMILLPKAGQKNEFRGADYLLASDPVSLNKPGLMGVMLNLAEGVSAGQILPNSAAARAGIEKDDRILTIADQPIQSLTDIRLALLDKAPGDQVTVQVQREGQTQSLTLELTLQ